MSPQETGNVLLELVSAMHGSERRVGKTPKEACKDPEIGKLLEAIGYDFLVETLELEQSIFDAEYPEMASLGVTTRNSMRKDVSEHLEHCRRCRLEARKDRVWKKNFVRFLESEREVVKKIVKEKRRTPRGKPRTLTAGSSR